MGSMGEGGHYIIGGYDHLGRRIAEELTARGCRVVIIERVALDKAGSLRVPAGQRVIVGNMLDPEVLRDAGVATAACLLAVTGDDQTNLASVMTAREIAPELRAIVRLFDQTLARGIERAFDVQALSASFLAQPTFIAAAADNGLMAAFDVDGAQLNIFDNAPSALHIALQDDELGFCTDDVNADDCFCASISELGTPAGRPPRRSVGAVLRGWLTALHPRALLASAREIGHKSSVIGRRVALILLLVAFISVLVFSTIGKMSVLDALYFVVTTLTTTGYGDIALRDATPLLKIYGIFMMLIGAALLATVYAIIADIVLSARIEYLLGRRAVTLSGHIVVIGLGKVGYRVAQSLHTLGFPVVAVEANEDTDRVIAARLNLPVIIGNAARTTVLQKAGIARARTVLALTDDPMLNLSVVLHARTFNPEIRAIVRTSGASNLSAGLRNLHLDAEISTSVIAAPIFANAAIYPGVEGSFRYHGQEILIVRHQITATSPYHGLTAAEVGAKYGVAAVLQRPNPEQPYHLTTPESELATGQTVVLLVTRGKMGR